VKTLSTHITIKALTDKHLLADTIVMNVDCSGECSCNSQGKEGHLQEGEDRNIPISRRHMSFPSVIPNCFMNIQNSSFVMQRVKMSVVDTS